MRSFVVIFAAAFSLISTPARAAECFYGPLYEAYGGNVDISAYSDITYRCTVGQPEKPFEGVRGALAYAAGGVRFAEVRAWLPGMPDYYEGNRQGPTAGYGVTANGGAWYIAERSDPNDTTESCTVYVDTDFLLDVINFSLGAAFETSPSELYARGPDGTLLRASSGGHKWHASSHRNSIIIPAGEIKSEPKGIVGGQVHVSRNTELSQGIGLDGHIASARISWGRPIIDDSASECDAFVYPQLPPQPLARSQSADSPNSDFQGFIIGISEGTTPDADMDGRLDSEDAYPNISLGFLEDTDFDGIPNDCDADCILTGMTADLDDDGDGFLDEIDNCPLQPNPDQLDTDNDGAGDACDSAIDPDTDGDGMPDNIDNCIGIANPLQEDANGDGCGDACITLVGCSEVCVNQ